jgi:hypothetical protein
MKDDKKYQRATTSLKTDSQNISVKEYAHLKRCKAALKEIEMLLKKPQTINEFAILEIIKKVKICKGN